MEWSVICWLFWGTLFCCLALSLGLTMVCFYEFTVGMLNLGLPKCLVVYVLVWLWVCCLEVVLLFLVVWVVDGFLCGFWITIDFVCLDVFDFTA